MQKRHGFRYAFSTVFASSREAQGSQTRYLCIGFHIQRFATNHNFSRFGVALGVTFRSLGSLFLGGFEHRFCNVFLEQMPGSKWRSKKSFFVYHILALIYIMHIRRSAYPPSFEVVISVITNGVPILF